MSLIWTAGGPYRRVSYGSEADLEAAILEVQAELFGPDRIYLDFKKKIGCKNPRSRHPDVHSRLSTLVSGQQKEPLKNLPQDTCELMPSRELTRGPQTALPLHWSILVSLTPFGSSAAKTIEIFLPILIYFLWLMSFQHASLRFWL